MSKSVSIYQSELTFSKNKINQLIKSIKHSMRIDYEEKNINYNYDKSGENKIFIYNGNDELQGIQGKDLSLEKRELLLQQLENLLIENEYQVMDAKVLSNLKRDFKSALKTDEDAIKKRKPRDEHLTNEQLTRRKELTEKIFKYLNDGLKGNVLKDKEMLEYLELVPKKRFDKVLKIKNENLNKQSFDNKTIQAIESIFKIPVENDVDLSAEESRIINEDFYKTHFPNYEIVASFEHNDEKLEKLDIKGNVLSVKVGGDHTHNFLKAKNKLTGEYDYSKTKYNLVVEQLRKEWDGLETKEDFKNWYFNSYFELENIPEDFLNLKTEEQRIKYLIGDLTKKDKRYVKTQNRRFGTIYQNIVFDFVNNHQIFKNRGLKAEKFLFMGATREEIFKNKNKLSLQDKNLKNKRDFNGLELAKINTQKREEYINKLENQVADYEETIKDFKEMALEEVKGELETLTTEKTNIKKDIQKLTQTKQDLDDSLVGYQDLIDKEQDDYALNKRIEIDNKIKDYKDTLNKELEESKAKVEGYKEVIKSSNYKEYLKYNDNLEYGALNEDLDKKAFNEAYKKHYEEIPVDEVVVKKIKDYQDGLIKVSNEYLKKDRELTDKKNEIIKIDIKLSSKQQEIKEFNDFKKIVSFYNVDDKIEALKKSPKQITMLKNLFNIQEDYERLKNSTEQAIQDKAHKIVKEWKEQELTKLETEIEERHSQKTKKLQDIETNFKEFKENDQYFSTMNNLNVLNVFTVLKETIEKSREKDTKYKDYDTYKNNVEKGNATIKEQETKIKGLEKNLRDFSIVNNSLREEIKEKDTIIDKLSSRVKTLTNRVKTAINGVRDREEVINYLQDKRNEFMNKGKSVFKSISKSFNFKMWGLDRTQKETASLSEVKYQKDNNEISVGNIFRNKNKHR